MSDNIPFDIQLEIIKRVSDVKSLIRSRAVSKPWKSFIDNPEFIACFGVRHTQPHRLLLRYTHNVRPYEVKYVSFVDGENHILTQQKQKQVAQSVPLLIKQLHMSNVIGSSCGLWCLHGFKDRTHQTQMLVIWNPLIRKSVGIVVPYELTTFVTVLTYFGFGVCPTTYDPTIVIMSYLDTVKWQVRIFTLSSKTWKMIPSSNFPRESICRVSNQVAIDRFIYWFSQAWIVSNDGESDIHKFILSYDLITNEFKEINLPHSLANNRSSNFSLSKLSESLVVSTYVVEAGKLVYGVWMMAEEGGVMTSFTKLFHINTPDYSSIGKLLGFTVSGEPIMETGNDSQQFAKVKVYKPCSEHMHNLGINGERDSFFICHYTESLLLVDHSDCCIISNDSRETNDDWGARPRAWNDEFWKLTIALMIFGFMLLGLMKFYPN